MFTATGFQKSIFTSYLYIIILCIQKEQKEIIQISLPK